MQWLRRSRLPLGAMAACLLISVIHVVAAFVLYPEPLARESLRWKVLALTAQGRPSIMVAGDSRAENNVIPDVLAAQLGLPGSEIVNIGTKSGEPASAVAAYREFAHRFAYRPIMLLSVGIWSVNDRMNQTGYLNDETLWSLRPVDRFRLAPWRRFVESTFLPEKAAVTSVVGWLSPARPGSVSLTERGYLRNIPDGRSKAAVLAKTANGLANVWYRDARVDGIRWRLFEANLDRLLADGVQVVVLDAPQHPAVFDALAGTSGAAANDRFHRQLVDICRHKRVPLLSYDASVFKDRNLDELYEDVSHLTGIGATLWTEVIGRDTRRLVEAGELKVPR